MIWTIRFNFFFTQEMCWKLEVFSDNGSLRFHPVGGGNAHFAAL